MINNINILFRPERCRRQLSVSYLFNGVLTSDDPASYEGNEKANREDVLIQQHFHTGYAEGILARRNILVCPYQFNGEETLEHPSLYDGVEREARENAILEQQPFSQIEMDIFNARQALAEQNNHFYR